MITNLNLWELVRSKYPSFASHTPKGTAELFTEKGWEMLRQLPENPMNDFWGLLIRVYLQQVNISHAKDTLEEKGFGEYYDNPRGGFIQRMSINSIKPISPAYKGLQNGDSPDPHVLRKPEVGQRFFQVNFDYASVVSIPDDFQQKQIFITEFGMDEFMGGIMEGLRNGYTIQVYENKLEVLNAALNSTEFALQDTQKVQTTFPKEVDATTEGIKDAIANFILQLKNIASAIDMAPQTSAYNALGFATTQDLGRLKLLCRPGIKNAISVLTLAGAFNPGELSLPFDIIEVPHFGGLVPGIMVQDTFTEVYPVYNKVGEEIGFNTSANQTTANVDPDDLVYQDPNEDVLGILADKGAVFYSQQNGYEVESIRNPRGRYTNYWASSPNNTIAYDPLYTFIELDYAEET